LKVLFIIISDGNYNFNNGSSEQICSVVVSDVFLLPIPPIINIQKEIQHYDLKEIRPYPPSSQPLSTISINY
jgi:hypothetical protein